MNNIWENKKMLQVKELGRGHEEPVATFEIDYRQISLGGLIRYLKRLSGLQITHHSSWPMTDDCLVEFTYKGFPFSIDSPFVHFWVHSDGKDCPEPIFREIIQHLSQYRLPWWRRLYVPRIK